MESTIGIMMELLRCSALGIEPKAEVVASLNNEMLNDMYTIAYNHDLVHLLGDALDKTGVLQNDEVSVKLREQVFSAIYRYEKLNFEFQRICNVFEENSIDFIPLKGYVLRDIYSEPWLRTSCDADILVKESHLKKAQKLLENLSFDKTHESSHDVTYVCGEGVIIELHFSLSEGHEANESSKILNRVWEYAKPLEGVKNYHILDHNFFYFYHIAHIAKHFEIGGCGIKPLLDLHVLKTKKCCDTPEIRRLLKDSSLERFEYALSNLSDVWFSGKRHDDTTLLMEEFIIKGEVYGNESQLLLMKKRRTKSRFGYILSRIFVPARELKYTYPILKKVPTLLPVYEVKRWIDFIVKGDKNKSRIRYKEMGKISEENIQKTEKLFNKIGLEAKNAGFLSCIF